MKYPARSMRGIALRRLDHPDRPEIVRHLLRLSKEDRRLRFGTYMRDASLERYAAGIDLSEDTVFGVRASAGLIDASWFREEPCGSAPPDLELIGMAHLALHCAAQVAELALSVDATHRGKGYGTALLQQAILHATNLGYRELFIHFLTENAVVMHLARKAGLSVVINGSEAIGCLALEEYTDCLAGEEADLKPRRSTLNCVPYNY